MGDVKVAAERLHVWTSNSAFHRMTGIKYICMDCGAGVEHESDAPKPCPGRRVPALSQQDPD